MVHDNNNTYDAVGIINHYIRTSSFCTLSSNNKNLYVTVDDAAFGGTAGQKHTVCFAYDMDDEVLYIDRMDGTSKVIVAEYVSDIDWQILSNGVKYVAYKTAASGTQEKMFSGYAYKRGGKDAEKEGLCSGLLGNSHDAFLRIGAQHCDHCSLLWQ